MAAGWSPPYGEKLKGGAKAPPFVYHDQAGFSPPTHHPSLPQIGQRTRQNGVPQGSCMTTHSR